LFVKNPHWHRQVNYQHRSYGVANGYLIGLYFFNENVNRFNYLHFLQHELIGLLENINFETRQYMWFQQESAPAHSSRIVRDHLNLTFPDKWIDRYGPIAFPG